MKIEERRLGTGAVLLAAVYGTAISLPDSAQLRLAFGLTLGLGVFLFIAFVPLPKWRESPEQLKLANRFAYAIAAMLVIASTVNELSS